MEVRGDTTARGKVSFGGMLEGCGTTREMAAYAEKGGSRLNFRGSLSGLELWGQGAPRSLTGTTGSKVCTGLG